MFNYPCDRGDGSLVNLLSAAFYNLSFLTKEPSPCHLCPAGQRYNAASRIAIYGFAMRYMPAACDIRLRRMAPHHPLRGARLTAQHRCPVLTSHAPRGKPFGQLQAFCSLLFGALIYSEIYLNLCLRAGKRCVIIVRQRHSYPVFRGHQSTRR